jgi:diguanylate cyclase (GGDEF)-like protein/PAS domain S-box-containing protein
LAKELINDNSKLLIAFVDSQHTNGEEFLNGIVSINDNIIVAGGHAGDNSNFVETLVFTKEHIYKKGAVAVSLSSNLLNVYTDYSFNWHPIGNELTVTKAEGNRIYTIDGKNAADIYAYYLGNEIAKGLPGIGIEFPLIVNRNGLNIARAIMAKEEDGSLILAGTLHTGDKVRIGFGDSKGIIKDSEIILKQTAQKPSECIFVYSCTARRHFMGNDIEAEILPLQNIAPVSGFFTHGEFFTSTKKDLLNQTMTLVSLSENNTVNNPNIEIKSKYIDIAGASMHALIHLIDVSNSEKIKQTQKLKTSNKLNKQLRLRMEMALQGSKTSILDWDFTNDNFYISPSWKEMLGFRDNELKNQTLTWYKRVHHDDKKNVFTLLREHQDNQIKYFEFNHRLKHRDGHWVWVLGRAQILFDKNGKKVRMIGTHTDITEEKELQLKYIYQAQIIEQVHDSIITTDLDGNIVSWNLGSEKIFGYTASETINENISMIYRQEDISTYTQYIPTLMKKGIFNADMYFVKKSKELIPISFSLSLLKDENGNPIGVVSINKDNTQRKKAEAQLDEQKSILYHQAHHDALTGLPNRVLLFDRLKQSIIKAKHHSEKLALFFIDLDKFKYINDSLGHDIGDSVLKIISKRLKNIVSTEDTVARLSGDEFTIILDDFKNPEDASILAENILRTLKKPMYIDNHTLYVSGSIGISIYPNDGVEGRDLLKYSDTAMYKAKEEGRNNFQFYSSSMTEFAMNRMVMKTNLQEAINGEELFINYQPQINSCTDKLVGMEALVRWSHPIKGLLMPDKFIPLAEDTGMIIELDKWVMRTTMKQVSNWYKEGLNPGVLGLNLSVKQLESHDFIQIIKESINKYDFKAEWLELEITERQMMTKPEDVISRLKEINDLGIAISIDDFGTGYSSLSLLKKLPIHRLKIDQSFIRDIPNNEEDVAIVNAIIALANSLKLDIVAEGVESSQQKDFLINSGCINMQGYYFSHPVSSTEMRTILLNESSNP